MGSGPLYLFADSQLLFWKSHGRLLLEDVREPTTAAAYIGASNADLREFYGIFEAAMDAVGITDRQMINSDFSPEDREFLNRAQLIVLSGGDVRRGWTTFEQTGMKELILAKHAEGAVLVGISAGAVQLGRHAVLDESDSPALELFDTFNLVPALIDVHDEKRDWPRLTATVRMLEGSATGIGIPTGGGMVFHPDGTAAALRHSAHEFRWDGMQLVRSLLLPDEHT